MAFNILNLSIIIINIKNAIIIVNFFIIVLI
jgi:hypothetical protein